jgi:hypothetical protein
VSLSLLPSVATEGLCLMAWKKNLYIICSEVITLVTMKGSLHWAISPNWLSPDYISLHPRR